MANEVVMTRETKIGLLVGLAFIIVIGILLSDHLTSSTEPPPAQLTQAGESVRGGTQIPNAGNVALANPVAPGPIVPQGQVPTPNDLNGQHVGPTIRQVAIGPAQPQSPNTLMPQQGHWPTTPTGSAHIEAPTQATNAVNPIYQQPPAAPQTEVAANTGTSNDALSHVVATAHQMGQDLVPAKPGQSNGAAATSGREYKAVAGDNLSRLAAKMPNGNTRANRDAIIAANPSLKANPDLIVAGRTYVLPTSGTTTPAALPLKPTAASAFASASRQDRTYTVKAGDSLWRIANDVVGDAHMVGAIKELNKQLLDGSDTLKVGMVLRLPARRVASAD
jgi:nucleoid-associated protein YgaU